MEKGFVTSLIVSLLIVSAIWVAGISFLVSGGVASGVIVPTKYISAMDSHLTTQQIIDANQQTLNGGQINPNGQDQAVYTNTIIAGKQIQNSGTIFYSFINNSGMFIQVNPVIIVIITSTVIFLIAMGFLALIMKGVTP